MARRTDGAKASAKRRRSTPLENIAEWDRADAGLLREVVKAVARLDGAVRFGISRDGGAYAIGIYGDGQPFTEYLPGNGDIDEWLRGFISDYA